MFFLHEAHKLKQIAKLKQDHFEWREQNFKYKEGFYPVFKGFKKHMQSLSPGAISLFLYLGLHSNNLTGESSHSIETIASFFNKSTRTISAWIKELEEQDLIERVQIKFNGVSHTFIKPYSWKKQNDKIDVNDTDVPF